MSANIKHTYKTSYLTVSQPPGFADFVIGTMSLFCLNDNDLYIDYTKHPISNFIYNEYNKTPDNLFEKEDITELFNTSLDVIVNCIQQSNKPINIATNTRGYILSNNVRDFAIKAFKPKSILQDEINKIIDNFNLHTFEVVHIRLGDSNMHQQIDNNYKELLVERIRKNAVEKEIFLTSDNQSIKDYLQEKIPTIKMLNNKPIHLGDLNFATIEDVKQTLLDFYIMSKSEKINCYSVYGGSGFSKVCSDIYNIKYEASFI